MTPRKKPPPRRIEYVRVDELPGDPENPKDHDGDGIRRSISTLGFIEPIVLDERTGLIVSGHGRKDELVALEAAARSLLELDADADVALPDGIVVDDAGRWLAPLVRGWASTDDDHARAAVVALNHIGERGGWLIDPLTRQLEALRDGAPALLEVTGYSPIDIDDLRASLIVPDFRPSDDAATRLDRKQCLVCPECGHHVDPATAARVDV